ncbi:MAG: glutamate-1-semialdehyde 2,1-aminomutase [Armatimonadota bacterium]
MSVTRTQSEALHSRAQQLMPGGVNSPVRAFRAVGGVPVFIDRAQGSRYWDVDGNEYIDYVCSWGPLIHGHAADLVIDAVAEAAAGGTSFGAPTAREIEMAELVVEACPSVDMVRMVNSGTEAVMSAIRAARGYTGRDKVVKFIGCWHGHADGLLVKAGSTGMTFGIPDSAGVPAGYAESTVLARFNSLQDVEATAGEAGEQIAAIVVEPVAGNMGVIPPAEGFLQGLRRIADAHDIVLILDEVITGFRVAYGGAQELYGVRPDMTTFGKIVGGGLPVGAYGGRRDIMECVAPLGDVVQAGTLAGNPIAMAAGIATIRALQEDGTYERLEERSAALADGLSKAADEAGVTVTLNRVGSMMSPFFCAGPVTDADGAAASDGEQYATFFHAMLDRGVALAPSKAEAAFVSTAHTDEDIDLTIEAARDSFSAI